MSSNHGSENLSMMVGFQKALRMESEDSYIKMVTCTKECSLKTRSKAWVLCYMLMADTTEGIGKEISSKAKESIKSKELLIL